MRLRRLNVFTHSYVERQGLDLAGLILLAFALDVAAAAGIAYVAGFGAVSAAWHRFSPIWLVPVAGGILLSFVGYYYAYKEIFRAKHGPTLPGRQIRAIVLAGFGGFFAHGGAAMDQYALQGAGADESEARVRVDALGGLEHGALGIVGTAAGAAALALARPAPPLDFQWPWAVIPIPGMLFAFWLAKRYHRRVRRRGWKEHVANFLDAVDLIRHMFRHPGDHWGGPVGMTVFWLAELGAAWSALSALGFHMNGASFAIGYLTGAVFTRRTGPLAGAGVLMLTLSVTLWYSGAPFGAAVGAVFILRFLSFWLPMPFSLASLPTLRVIGEAKGEKTRETMRGEPAVGDEERQAG